MKIAIVSLLSCLFCLYSLAFGQEEEKKDEFNNMPRIMLEKTFSELSTTQKQLKEEIDTLEELHKMYLSLDISEIKIDKNELTSATNQVKKNLEKINIEDESKLPKINIEQIFKPLEKFILIDFSGDIKKPFRSVRSSYDRNSYNYNYSRRIESEIFDQEISSGVDDPISKIFKDEQIKFEPIGGNTDEISIEVLKPLIPELIIKLSNLPEILVNFINEQNNQQKQKKNEIINFLKGKKENLAKAHDDIGNKLTKIAEKLETQKGLDKDLIIAIYLMIGTLALLFLGLRIFPENTAILLIEKRSLVEVISMAFILITIIILGTGDRIGKETLGTLLGTIAGYIFGSRLGQDKNNNNIQLQDRSKT